MTADETELIYELVYRGVEILDHDPGDSPWPQEDRRRARRACVKLRDALELRDAVIDVVREG